MSKWLVLFLLTPLIEMYLLIRVGGHIGAWPTIGLVVLTAVVGVALLRVQGWRTLVRGLERLNAGEIPAGELVEGMLLGVAGALLLTPGFITDAIGFAFLTPRLRRHLADNLLANVRVENVVRTQSTTIEGEFERRSPPRA